jgi:hypothetical protein
MLIYDIEILNAVPPRSGPMESGVEYCQGWNDHQGMGISVIGVYDYRADRYRVFCEDNLIDFKLLIQVQECIVGFNNHRFDNRVLAAQDIIIPPEKSYDILEEVWRSLGLGPDFRPETHGGYSLAAICQANFGTTKTGNGAAAPLDWQRGRVGSIIDYCLQDIYLTKKLLDRIIRTGELRDPKEPRQMIRIRKPGAQ